MATTNALILNEKLSRSTGDWLRVIATTNINVGNIIVSTTFNQYDGGRDAYFQDWYCYCEDYNNAGVERQVKNYYTANATLRVWGSNFLNDITANLATIRLGRYSFGSKQSAINTAIMEVYPTIHKRVVDKTLATNSSFYEYALPASFQNGDVYQVAVNVFLANTGDPNRQVYSYTSFAITNEGNTLKLPGLYSTGQEIRIEGITPLETVVNVNDAVNVSGSQVDLLIAYAKYKLYQSIGQPISSSDVGRYEAGLAQAYAEYKRLLPRARMTLPARPLIQ